MPPRFQPPVPEHLREPHEVEVPGLWNLYVIAIGIAILIGLITGTVWIVWQIAAMHFSR